MEYDLTAYCTVNKRHSGSLQAYLTPEDLMSDFETVSIIIQILHNVWTLICSDIHEILLKNLIFSQQPGGTLLTPYHTHQIINTVLYIYSVMQCGWIHMHVLMGSTVCLHITIIQRSIGFMLYIPFPPIPI